MKVVSAALALALLGGSAAVAQSEKRIIPNEIPTQNPWRACTKSKTQRYYPPQAHRQNIEGAAMVQCRLDADYRMTACTWVEERPTGYGFGEAAAAIGCLTAVRPEMREPLSPTSVIVFPIRFTLPPR